MTRMANQQINNENAAMKEVLIAKNRRSSNETRST